MNKTHGMTGTRVYRIWNAMTNRCKYKSNKCYHRYGGRGIKVCDEWENSFTKFHLWSMSNGYTDELQLDRIDNDGNYEPTNCRWVTPVENCRSKPNNKLDIDKARDIRAIYKEGKHTQKEISKIYNVNASLISSIINNKKWRE